MANPHTELVSFVTTDWAAMTRGRSIPYADLDDWLRKGCGWVPANMAITPFDPIAWGLALSAMIAAAGVANFVPARRAMRVDPLTALRTE